MQALRERSLRPAEQDRVVYRAYPDTGTAYEDVLNPAFWAHTSRTLKRFDMIEVLPEDESYFAELLVVRVIPGGVIVKERSKIVFDEPVVEDDLGDLQIKWSGPLARWRVTRKSDNVILAEGKIVETREMAQQFVLDYRKAAA